MGITILGYIFFTARHRERMSIIDKGVDPSLFVSKGKSGTMFTLKLGMLAVGVSLGIIAAMILDEIFDNLHVEPVVIAMILLFGGASLIINFLIESRINSEPDNRKDPE
ncbi:hypothetical protein D9M69_728200 [compost metagenome]